MITGWYWRWSIVAVVLVSIAIGNLLKIKESFTIASNEILPRVNSTNTLEPWNKHPITYESIPIDTPIKYNKAFYYEMDNAMYDKALQSTFSHNCEAAKKVFVNTSWRLLDPTNLDNDKIRILTIYPSVIKYMTTTLNQSKYMKNKNGSPYLIQIVHDHILRTYQHLTSSNQFIIELETILYREFAAHGKHLRFKIFVEQSKNIEVVITELDILGIVPAEIIGFHPVLPIDNVEMDQNEMNFPKNPLTAFSTVLLDETTIRNVMDKQQKLQKADDDATNAIKKDAIAANIM